VANLRRESTEAANPVLDWFPDGRSLAVSDQTIPGGPFHIIRLSVDTGERQQLTSPPSQSYGDGQPAVSPDGQTVAFTRSVGQNVADIYIIPTAGGEPRRLTFDDSVVRGLAWTPDGGSVIFSSERGAMAGTGSLWRVAVGKSTSAPQQLSGVGPRATVPAVSRQGGLLAYLEWTRNKNLWRYALTGRESPQRIISSSREQDRPDYSPDGARIAFSSNRSGNWEVWVAQADGSNPRQITSLAGAPAWNPRWSPNGRLLAFHHAGGGNEDIYTITPEGSSLRRITAEMSREQSPSWSRDGRWIYFSSDRSGQFEIWKIATDDPARVVQLTRGGGLAPIESADGKRVLYTRRAGSAFDIWSTELDGRGETRVFGPVRAVGGWLPDEGGIYFVTLDRQVAYHRFGSRSTIPIAGLATDSISLNPGLALSPDGRWLVFGQTERSGSDIMLVENFR
jgi:Tol biopolymer transport system component